MNFKRSKKTMAIMLAMVMLFSLLLPVGSAFASSGITALSVPSVKDDTTTSLGTIRVNVPAGAINAGDRVNITLPSDYEFHEKSIREDVYVSDETLDYNGTFVQAPVNINQDTKNAEMDLEVRVIDSDNEIQIIAKNTQRVNEDFVFYVYLRNIEIDSGASGDAIVTFDGPADTGFPTGSVVVAKATSDGSVVLTTQNTGTHNEEFSFDLRVRENTAGSMEVDRRDSIKLELPDGYKWDVKTGEEFIFSNTDTDTDSPLWGADATFTAYNDDEVLELRFEATGDLASNKETTVASAWMLKDLKFFVDDEAKVETGDIIAKVSGRTDVDVTEVKVGTYGDFGAEVYVEGDVPTLVAGQTEQEIATIIIKEQLKKSLIEGRTITFTLPEGAKWQNVYEYETSSDDNKELKYLEGDKDNSLDIKSERYTGSENQTARFYIKKESGSNNAELELEEWEVAIEAGFTGDLEIEVAGSAGLSERLVVAKVIDPVEATASSVPSVVIGAHSQKAGDITLTENVEEAFIEDNEVRLELPNGVEFANMPKVEVVDGDLKIKNVGLYRDTELYFTIDRDSDEPSSVRISDVNLTVNRTVPEGNIELTVTGDALVETNVHEDWRNSDEAAKVAIARVSTAAESGTVVFNVGSPIYTIGNATKVMDAAPYIKNDRTYVPVRYLAYGLGVSEDDVEYENGVVTLTKGNDVVQLTIGSQTMMVNGNAVQMDVAPEISSEDRTMLPARFVAEAFGSIVGYADGTVVISN